MFSMVDEMSQTGSPALSIISSQTGGVDASCPVDYGHVETNPVPRRRSTALKKKPGGGIQNGRL